MIRIDESRVMYERGDADFDDAWTRLIDAGINPGEWMYMETDRGPHGGERHRFKNIRTRRYITIP